MDKFSLGAVFLAYGWWGSLIVITLWGLLVGFIAAWGIKELIRKGTPNEVGLEFCLTVAAVLTFWYFLAGQTIFDGRTWSSSPVGTAVYLVVSAIIYLILLAIMLSEEEDGDARYALLEKGKIRHGVIAWLLFGFFSSLVAPAVFIDEWVTSPLNKEDHAIYKAKEAKNIIELSELAPRYQNALPPLVNGLAQLYEGQYPQAAQNFAAHAQNVDKNRPAEQQFWLGLAHLAKGEDEAAKKCFIAAKEGEMVIALLYLRKAKINEDEYLATIKDSPGWLGNIWLIKRALVIRKPEPKQEKPRRSAIKNPELLALLDEFEKQMAEFNKKFKGSLAQPENEPPMPSKEAVWYSCLTRAYDRGMQALPKPTGLLPMGLLSCANMLFIGATLIFGRLYFTLQKLPVWQKIVGNFCLSAVKILVFLLYFIFQRLPATPAARRLALKIALLEKEKGFFSREIAAIHNNRFPTDIMIALMAYHKARRLAKIWEVANDEKNDIKLTYKEVRLLCGALIPQGDSQTLAVISGIKSKANDFVREFLKGKSSYPETRQRLLGIIDDLATIGDILEARDRKKAVSYYTLLGLSFQNGQNGHVKEAYRAVMKAIHPDRNDNNPHLVALASSVNEAYAVIGDPKRREVYNTTHQFH